MLNMTKEDIAEILNSFVTEYEDTHCSFEVIYPYQIPDIAKAIADKLEEGLWGKSEIQIQKELEEDMKETLEDNFGESTVIDWEHINLKGLKNG